MGISIKQQFIDGFDDGPDDREYWYNQIRDEVRAEVIGRIERLAITKPWREGRPRSRVIQRIIEDYNNLLADILRNLKESYDNDER